MNIAIGCDHGGFGLKKAIVPIVEQAGHTVVDLGCFSEEAVDYPDFADRVCAAIGEGHCQRGILICGTGIGMSIAANKVAGIRAAVCHDRYTADMARRHNDANVLAIGARVVSAELAREIVDVFLSTAFEEGGRHGRRVEMLNALDDR